MQKTGAIQRRLRRLLQPDHYSQRHPYEGYALAMPGGVPVALFRCLRQGEKDCLGLVLRHLCMMTIAGCPQPSPAFFDRGEDRLPGIAETAANRNCLPEFHGLLP